MAIRIVEHFIDDYDGEPVDRSEAESLTFAFGGAAYKLDLRPANAEKIRADFGKWIDKATRVNLSAGRGSASSTKSAVRRDKAQLQAIRNWANQNGFTVSDRGRIPGTVIAAFDAAH